MTRAHALRVPSRVALALALLGAGLAATARAQSPAPAPPRSALAQRIETTATSANALDVTKLTSKLIAAAQRVDDAAAAGDDANIAGRLAAEFHIDGAALAAEKQTLDTSWGNLMIAHTLSASAADATHATAVNLVGLHKDGMGWGKVAAGLGFKLGQTASAVETESKVALGQAQASGKVAHIGLAAKHTGDPDAAGADAAASAAGAEHPAGK